MGSIYLCIMYKYYVVLFNIYPDYVPLQNQYTKQLSWTNWKYELMFLILLEHRIIRLIRKKTTRVTPLIYVHY